MFQRKSRTKSTSKPSEDSAVVADDPAPTATSPPAPEQPTAAPSKPKKKLEKAKSARDNDNGDKNDTPPSANKPNEDKDKDNKDKTDSDVHSDGAPQQSWWAKFDDRWNKKIRPVLERLNGVM